MKRLFSIKAKELELSIQKDLYLQFFQTVYRTAFKYTGNESSALEVVQETYIRAFKYIHTYKEQERGNFKGWLLTITRNQAINYINQKWKYNEIPTEENIINVKNDEKKTIYVENNLINKLNLEEINEMLTLLHPVDRQVILLKIIHDRSHQEIAVFMRLEENNVRQKYHRALKKLKVLLQKKWSLEDE